MHCWEAEDRVPRRPELTQFRRRLRYHQAQTFASATLEELLDTNVLPTQTATALRDRYLPS